MEWDRFEDYLERIISFAVGVSWDEDEDVKQSAIRILGEYLASGLSLEAGRESNRDLEITLSDDQREVVLFLLRTFFDRTLESWTRQSAYCALLRASGVRAQGLPNDCVMLDFTPGSTDIDWGSVAFLQSLVDEENSSSSSSKPSADDVLGGPAIR